jgi:ABC transport system ATP-binding/permease protein
MLNLLGFPYAQHRQRVSSLSGGERRRLHLASVLTTKPNFLILDEPTNDLDLSTIEVLLIHLHHGTL